jgi:CRISPR-associated endoribonuclease Cas6
MTFEVEANPELIAFAYNAGFGEKNAMGFGCVDIVE